MTSYQRFKADIALNCRWCDVTKVGWNLKAKCGSVEAADVRLVLEVER